MKHSLKHVVCLMVLFFGLPVIAHPGHGLANFHDAFLHPVSGLDHLLVAIAVGMWAAQSKHSVARILSFLTGMIAGAVVGYFGILFPFFEQGILLSLFMLGVFLFTQCVLSDLGTLVVLMGFGVFHGSAHGAELGIAFNLATLLGLVFATALLHFGGASMVVFVRKYSSIMRADFALRCVGIALMGSAWWV